MRSRYAERSLTLEPTSMESAVPSLKWKTTASAACIPRRDSTSPYSMAATVFPTAPRTICSLCSGLGGPIILGCSWGVLRYWRVGCPSVLLRLLADELYLPTPRILPLLGRVPRPEDVKHVTSWRRRRDGCASLLVTMCPVCGLRVVSGPALRLRLPNAPSCRRPPPSPSAQRSTFRGGPCTPRRPHCPSAQRRAR